MIKRAKTQTIVHAALVTLAAGALLGSPLSAVAQTDEKAAQTEEAAAAPARAVVPAGLTIDQLLDRVRQGWRAERVENERREKEFRGARSRQKNLLEEARASLAAEEARSDLLEENFEQNELKIAEQEEVLASRLGTLGELFGVVRQVAGDTRSQVENSLVSAEYPGRMPFLDRLGQSKALPAIEDLEGLWAVLLQEMNESSKISRFNTNVVKVSGEEVEQEVIRIGAFNAISNGEYLKWITDVGKLGEIGRQPAPKFVDTIDGLETAKEGLVKFAIDPSRGQILALLVSTPDLRERIAFGGSIGYAIIILGSLTFIFGIIRLAYVGMVSRKVTAQKSASQPDTGNPLGRVLKIYADNRNLDTETLELKLEEQVLKESAKIESFLWLIKVVSAVAPLMGLLGTVTGMINTFQIITLFGTGDPKMMASGISEALVTTMLGLLTAIPLVLMHAVIYSMARGVTTVLEEQSTGLIATQSEAESASLGRPGIETA
ncbi:MAG: MotA/TolQ/ExbB proton channel family protein [Myxococcota bacterium]|nr:MotA/TolQ/ExbB proton channel family protein [Myxococcota bacterium]